ncbi:MAG: SusC/RagA family TonB-linked outer membrane protein [Chitinophagaceae bacterium]|nr:MAG: SusC/RagA family TonB-linked outer membrane protein [Chitinophagaceae bacterium]
MTLTTKWLLIMKFTGILLIAAFLQMSAATTAQTVTWNGKNVSMEKVFAAIKKQTGYMFFYRTDDLKYASPVTAKFNNEKLEKVLGSIFKDQSFTYKIEGNTIVVSYNPVSKTTKVETKVVEPLYIDIKGRVVDESGMPIAGATVRVKGNLTKGTSTNSEGYFDLRNIDEGVTLIISGVNIESLEIKLSNKSDLGNIVVRLKMITEEEIGIEVNTGYQKLSRDRATGAYDIINKDKIEKRIFTNVRDVLEGQVAGLSSFKGEALIRGVNTFSSNIGTDPLLVIDGLPTERTLDQINVNDIESITVLKDAAASSIYGVRAANGVIVIVTKGGKMSDKSKTTVQFTSDWKWVENPSLSDMHYGTTKDIMDYELASIQRAALKANRSEKDDLEIKLKGIGQAGTTSNSINYYTPLQMARLQFLRGEMSQADYDAQIAKWEQTDFRKEYMDLNWQTPLRQSYNLSINSTSKNQSTYASLNYINNGNQNKYNKSESLKGYIKSSQMLNKWFSFDIGSDIQYNHSVSIASSYGNLNMLEPYTQILDENGNKIYRDYVDVSGMQGGLHVNPKVLDAIKGLPQFESFRFNVMDELKDNLETRNYSNVRSFARFNFNISKSFKFSTSGEYEFTKDKFDDFRSKDSYFYRFLRNRFATNASTNAVIPEGGRLSTIEYARNSWVWRNQLDFNKNIGDHQITATGGVELKEIQSDIPSSTVYYGYDPVALTYTLLNNYDIYTTGYKNSYIYNNNTGLPGAVIDGNGIKIADSDMRPTLSSYMNRYVGMYAVGGYTFKNKYGFSGSVRVDQTNLFGTDPKYRYRPLWSAGVKWNMAREKFLQDISWINMLDFRFSYGLTGNVDQSTTPFLVAGLYNQSTYTAESIPYANILSAPNPMLRWEKTTSYNAGFDYNFFQGLLNGKLDVYYKKSDDLLGTKEVHFTSGYATQRVNSGAMSNKGIELTVSSPWYRSKDLTLASTLMVSYNKNKVIKTYFNPTQASHLAISGYLVNGKPFDALYAYNYGGLTSGGTEFQNGVPIIYRADGTTMHHFNADGTLLLDGSSSMGVQDVIFMGTKTPLVNASFTQNVRYKGFELSALFLYYGGHKMYKPSYGYNITDGNDDWTAKAWRPDNTSSEIPKALIYYDSKVSVVNMSSLEGMYARSTTNIASGDFVRLRNIALSYTLPTNFVEKLHMDRVRVSGQINNPWIWSAAGKQSDSEVQSSASNSASLRNWGLPMPTTYLLRFDITF